MSSYREELYFLLPRSWALIMTSPLVVLKVSKYFWHAFQKNICKEQLKFENQCINSLPRGVLVDDVVWGNAVVKFPKNKKEQLFLYSVWRKLSKVWNPRVDKWYGEGRSHLCPKKWLFFTNFGQGLSSKVGFFLIFWPILRAGFFDKMLALSNKKSTFVLISGFLAVVFSQFCSKITWNVAF